MSSASTAATPLGIETRYEGFHQDVSADAPPAETARAGPVLISCLLGAGVALGGFSPLNDIPSLLHTQTLVGFVALSPACLVAVASGVALWREGGGAARSKRASRAFALTFGLILLGALLSLLHSSRPNYSASLLISGLLAPAVLFAAVRSGRLAPGPLAGAFLGTLCVLLLRADIQFIREYGFPTSQRVLFNAKFHSQAHDFHYYTLGNPDHTANFLILPFALSLFWALGRSSKPAVRAWLLSAAGVIFFTIVLLYVRFADFAALLLILAALSCAPWPRRVRWASSAAVALIALLLAVLSPGHYILDIFTTGGEASGTVRINTISAGWQAFVRHPLTGVGLGQYNNSTFPAHSSIVQAGAEMGIFGLLGIALMTALLLVAATRRIRARRWRGLTDGALVAAALSVIYAAVSPAASEGLMVGYVSIYALTLALVAGIGLSATSHSGASHMPIAMAAKRFSDALRVRARERCLSLGAGLSWLSYGAVWAIVAGVTTASRLPSRAVISESRAEELTQLLAAHSHGFGPLVEMVGPGTFRPAGLTDDPGAYLYVPWLSSILHTQNIDTLLRVPYIACMAALIGVYPYLMWRLTRSRLAALAAPAIVLASFGVSDWQGFYWVPGLAIALCLPWLLVLARDRSAPPPSLILLGAAAGTASSFRANTGLGVLAAALVVCSVAAIPWRARMGAAILTLGAYLLMSVGVVDLAYQARAERMGNRPIYGYGIAGFTKWSDRSGHPLWHTVYIGLGVIHNRYGISYNDSVAAAYVHKVDPTAAFVSPRYEAILRKRVIHIAETDPGFVAKAEARKAELQLRDGLDRFTALIFLLPLALLASIGRRRRLLSLGVLAPVAIMAFAPAMIAIPEPSYEIPWFGVLASVTVMTACGLLGRVARFAAVATASPRLAGAAAPLQQCVTDLQSHMRRSGERATMRLARLLSLLLSPLRRLASALGAGASRLLVAVVQSGRAVAVAIKHIDWAEARLSMAGTVKLLLRSRYSYAALMLMVVGLIGRHYLGQLHAATPEEAGAPVEPFDVRLAPAVRYWGPATIAAKWTHEVPGVGVTLVHGSLAPAARSLAVRTSAQSQAYQLMSPTVVLPAGRYLVVVKGSVRDGGMTLGILDAKSRTWVQTGVFTSVEAHGSVTMPVVFDLPRSMPVDVILANYTPHGQISIWQLRRVSINPYRSPSLASPGYATHLRARQRLTGVSHHAVRLLTRSAPSKRASARVGTIAR